MLKMQMLFTIISFSILPIVATSCSARDKHHSGGPYYFESFANYKIPFKPIRELSPDEANTREAYYIAYYDDLGRIISFTKYLRGKIEFNDKYIYDAKGFLERRELSKSTGEIIIQHFDKNGKLIEK